MTLHEEHFDLDSLVEAQLPGVMVPSHCLEWALEREMETGGFDRWAWRCSEWHLVLEQATSTSQAATMEHVPVTVSSL